MYLYILINVYFTCTNQNVNSHKFYTLDYCLHCSGSKLYLMLSFWKRILFYLGYCNKSRGNERILQPKKIDGEYEGKVFCCFNSFSEGFDKLLMAFCIKSRQQPHLRLIMSSCFSIFSKHPLILPLFHFLIYFSSSAVIRFFAVFHKY